MWSAFAKRLGRIDADIWFFLGATACMGFAASVVSATFNNFLNEAFHLSNLQRSVIELPRELPGVLVVFVSACFFFLCSRRLAVVAMLLAALGMGLVALAPVSFQAVMVWLFILSLGQHIFLPLNSGLGMELARPGQTGRRLGQFNAVNNLTTILGSFAIFLGFKYFRLDFKHSFTLAAVGFLCAAVLLFGMRPRRPQPAAVHLKLHREYRLYYWLAILYGTRKQIFLTFAPWVLVTVYNQPTQMIATLLTIGGIAGIVFQPWLGKLIDTLGERFVLTGEALVLIVVCLLYGFAGTWFAPAIAWSVVCGCYVTDQLLMSVGIARATYLKKIALDPAHVNPTLTAATSIDHVFSIATALVSGLIWKAWGYQFVFALGAGIAVVNAFSTLRIVIPPRPQPADLPAARIERMDTL